MSTITGTSGHVDHAALKRLGYRSVDVGCYVFSPRGRPKSARAIRRIVVAGVVCPFCRGPLKRLDPRDGRVKGRVIAKTTETRERFEIVVDPLPDTHWCAGCNGCDVQFAVPKRAPRAFRSGADDGRAR